MAVIKRDVVIDPRFVVPPSVIDVRQENETDGSSYYEDGDLASEAGVLENSDILTPNVTTFTIVSQTIRITADGGSVVDVVIDFPEVDEVSELEVDYTKL